MAAQFDADGARFRIALQNAWSDAAKTYDELKAKGDLTDAQYAMLKSQAGPRELLETIKQASYTTKTDSRLLSFAEGSVDAIVRFDKEISTLASGASSASVGVSNLVWGGLRFVVHVAEDIFKTPGVVLEVVAKIFVFMPRIELYWKLFHDKQDVLNVRELLVEVYEKIIHLNVEAARWYTKSKIGKALSGIKADPRKHFESILTKMTEATDEMEKRVKAINLQDQETRQNQLLGEFRTLDENQRTRMEELRAFLTQLKVEETAEHARQQEASKALKAAEAAKRQEAEAEKQDRKGRQDEIIETYGKTKKMRGALWNVIHKSQEDSFTVVYEDFLSPELLPGLGGQNSGVNWKEGRYTLGYPEGAGKLADILLTIDWRPDERPDTPEMSWEIFVPNSTFYPGFHTGHFEFSNYYGAGRGRDFDIFDSRLCIFWESPIFSSFPADHAGNMGMLSSVGPLEDKNPQGILRSALYSLAHLLVHGPFVKVQDPLFALHVMSGKEARYFGAAKPGEKVDEDRCMRATAFFANAASRESFGIEGLIGFSPQCRDISSKAIKELLEFYELDKIVAKKAKSDPSWLVEESYQEVKNMQKWTEKDYVWAVRIAELAELNFLTYAYKRQDDISKTKDTH